MILRKIEKRFLSTKIKREVWNLLRQYGHIPISETRENDVFIVGYPKSGNTWMQFMIASLINGIDTNLLNFSLIHDFVPDVHYKQYYKRYRDRCFFKSHDLPKPFQKKVIYLVRDGRDAIVSYHHMNQALALPYSYTEMIIDGKGLFPCKWHEHIKAWTANPFNAEILFVKYEDLKTNPLEQMQRINNFCDLKADTIRLNEVIDGCSFENLKSLEINQGLKDGAFHWNGNKENRFFRKGNVGGYRVEIEEQLLSHFEFESREQLQAFGYLTEFEK